MELLKALFDEVWKNKCAPPNFVDTKMTAIFKKKGDPKDPSKYRMIQTSNLLSKILSTILLQRIIPWYERQLKDYQLAFRQGSWTSEGILAIRTLQTIAKNTNQNIFVLISDMTAGFDTVVREWVFQSLQHRLPQNCDWTKFLILQCLYQRTEGRITNINESIMVNIGTRQGAIEAAAIWSLWID